MKNAIRGSALVLLASAGVASAQDTGKRSASDAASAFTLNGLPASDSATVPPVDTTALPEADAVPSSEAFAPAAAATEPAAAPAQAPATPSRFTVDTPIAELIADPRSRKILDREMPGVSTDANLDKFRALSLRKFQPLTGGQLTDALLAKIAGDLAAIPPAKGRNEGR